MTENSPRASEQEMIEAAERSLMKALYELDRTSYAMQAGAAARVAGAAYALAVLRRQENIEAPAITTNKTVVEKRSLF